MGGGVTIAHRTGEWKVRGERSFVVRSVALSDKSGAINSKLAEEEGEGRKVLLSSLVGWGGGDNSSNGGCNGNCLGVSFFRGGEGRKLDVRVCRDFSKMAIPDATEEMSVGQIREKTVSDVVVWEM